MQLLLLTIYYYLLTIAAISIVPFLRVGSLLDEHIQHAPISGTNYKIEFLAIT